MRAIPPLENERGVALIIAAWVLLALSILAVEACRGAKTDMSSIEYYGAALESENLALSSLKEAESAIPKMASETIGRSREMKDAEGKTVGRYSYIIVDESGRMDVNSATIPELTALLRLLKTDRPEAEAAGIARERDRYPGRAFTMPVELLNVDGITDEIYFGEDANGNMSLDPGEDDGDASWPPDNADGKLEFGLARYVRAACPGKININRATREVLLSVLNAPPETVDEITAADGGGKQRFSISQALLLPGIDAGVRSRIIEKLSDVSDCFLIRAEGESGENGPVKTISALAGTGADGKPEIIQWWES